MTIDGVSGFREKRNDQPGRDIHLSVDPSGYWRLELPMGYIPAPTSGTVQEFLREVLTNLENKHGIFKPVDEAKYVPSPRSPTWDDMP